MRAPDGYVYEVVNVTGPMATHTLTDGDGWVQKRHPWEGYRQAGFDGSSPTQIVARQSRRYLERKPAGPRKVCVNGHTHRGVNCEKCRTTCVCGSRINKRGADLCWMCRSDTPPVKSKRCVNGHRHWGAICAACQPKCITPGCPRRVRTHGRATCSDCSWAIQRRKTA